MCRRTWRLCCCLKCFLYTCRSLLSSRVQSCRESHYPTLNLWKKNIDGVNKFDRLMLFLTVLILGRYKFDLFSQGVLKLKHTFAAIQKAVSSYFTSKKILPFGFAGQCWRWRCTCRWCLGDVGTVSPVWSPPRKIESGERQIWNIVVYGTWDLHRSDTPSRKTDDSANKYKQILRHEKQMTVNK